MIELLLRHGANHLEPDPRTGVLPLHWAAGAGRDVAGVAALLAAHTTAYQHEFNHSQSDQCAEVLLNEREPKDGATALHWACCGVRSSVRVISSGSREDDCAAAAG